MDLLDHAEFDRWRASATENVDAARTMRDARHHRWACFLAEQAAQCALKALGHGVGANPRGHDLVELGRAAPAYGAEPPEAVWDALRRLSRHYQPTRYADVHAAGTPSIHYGKSDADEAIADAEAVCAFVDGAWAALLKAAEE